MAKKLTVRLGKRQAVWNPGVAGFDGLNGITPEGTVEVTIDQEKQPELYQKALTAIQFGLLVVPLKENDVDTESKAPAIDVRNTKEDLPSVDKTAKTLLATLNTDELLTKLDSITEVGIISAMMEAELNGENRVGKPRDKVKVALRNRIKELELPNE